MAALITTQITASGRGAIQVSSNLLRAAELEAAADGAVHEAMFRMMEPGPTRWRADGSVRALPGGIDVVLENLAGRINPNQASPELLMSLFRQLRVDAQRARALADAIADWRDPSAQRRPFGAKAPDYRQAGRSYGPPEAPIQSIGELSAVLGMTPDLLSRLAPHLTVYRNGEPEAAVAGPVVLAALRASLGAQEFAAATQTGPRVVAVTATARGPGRTRFTRRAVVSVGEGDGGGGHRILAWGIAEAEVLALP
ncbi:MAG: general secretion pathway protein GspK [Rubritepida sp.]|nr:general secretion pathway protein GspK [Rubritepida sp.]